MRDPTGTFIRRAIDLRRYENGLVERVVRSLSDARDDIARQLRDLDPTAVSTGYRRRRLEALRAQVEETLKTVYGEAGRMTRTELVGLADHYATLTKTDLQSIIGPDADVGVRSVSLSPIALRTIVDTSPVRGWVMRDWWAEQSRATANRFEQQVRIGLTQGETIDQLVVRVRGRAIARGKYEGGIMETSTRAAEALVRTATNTVVSGTQRRVLEANKDVAPKYRYTATLDNRTTPICQALDGQVFPVDDPEAPRPPQHWNCRSTMVPVVDWAATGLTPPKPGTRAAKDGPVPSGTTYNEWLRDQSAANQDEILGPARARMFRAGDVDLRDLVSREGRQWTLEELKARL